jgi:hypothetical protein
MAIPGGVPGTGSLKLESGDESFSGLAGSVGIIKDLDIALQTPGLPFLLRGFFTVGGSTIST